MGAQQTKMDQLTAPDTGGDPQPKLGGLSGACEPSGAQIMAVIETSGQAVQAQIAAIAVDVNPLKTDLRAVAESSVATEHHLDVLKATVATLKAKARMLEARTRVVEWEALKVVIRGKSIGKTYGIRKKLEQELMQQEDALSLLQSQEQDGATGKAGLLEACGQIEVKWNRLDSYVRKEYRQAAPGGHVLGHMLAWLLKHERPLPLILSLHRMSGEMILGQKWVNLLLREHLSGASRWFSGR
ncbi:hypothetical protein NDU88_000482 [Pleurodeles waltl]|uniref:Uncharacterized protein n=1 Tax=Pleurodeles waltl TaxID=8319 RepID=A0AAV7N9R5_PLEWA|nr:hypothetical protein NDU88_000482 [Pleurodeles waltl]